MKKVICYLLLTVFSICFTGRPVAVEKNDSAQERQFTVSVGVTCDNESIKNLIESHIKRELRSLGDVRLANFEDAKFKISVVAVTHKYKSTRQETGGISLAYIFLGAIRPFPESNIEILRKMIRPESLDAFDEFANILMNPKTTYYALPSLFVGYWPSGEKVIDTQCRKIVAQFDIEELEPFRELFR